MGKKLTDKALVEFEAKRDIWQEVLDGVREIKADGGKRTKVEAKSYIVCVRFTTQLYSDPYSTNERCRSPLLGLSLRCILMGYSASNAR